jgi:hypothetical protein
MIDQEAYNYYQRQKEIVDSWMQYDYINKLYNNLRTVVYELNWLKSNIKANQKDKFINNIEYLKQLNKCGSEVDNIIRKLKLVNAYNEITRANKIKVKTCKRL